MSKNSFYKKKNFFGFTFAMLNPELVYENNFVKYQNPNVLEQNKVDQVVLHIHMQY
jgi:hypothetical protein